MGFFKSISGGFKRVAKGPAGLAHVWTAPFTAKGMLGQQSVSFGSPMAGVQASLKNIKAEQKTLDEELRKRLEGSKAQEEQFKKDLTGERVARQELIDQELARRLEEAGIAGGEERESIGEGFAEKGLLRSSMAGEAVGESQLREQAIKGQTRLEASEAKEQAMDVERETLKQISREKELTKLQLDQERSEALERARSYLTDATMRGRIESEMASLKLRSEQKQAVTGIIGGLAGSVGKLFGGGI